MDHFFRHIDAEIDGRHYVILLKRFFIDKDMKVNCIFGKVQFYSSLDGQINEDDETKSKIITDEGKKKATPKIIHYPKSCKAQNEKMIRVSNTNQKVVVYNPKMQGNIEYGNVDNLSEEIVKLFIDFVNCVQSKTNS